MSFGRDRQSAYSRGKADCRTVSWVLQGFGFRGFCRVLETVSWVLQGFGFRGFCRVLEGSWVSWVWVLEGLEGVLIPGF